MNKKEHKIIELIKNKIHTKNPNAEVILFDSHARGDANKNSDWDILILLNKSPVDRLTEKAYREEIFDVELEIGEPISTFVYSKNNWQTRHSVTPLYKNIEHEGIRL
ncbi:MAG: nucleotidyltransferase domain-containing protein [Victivallaceae bacterium]|nr:nucleotidyltransferase domain-containing protein [Victivallaceae bacterium]